MPFLMPDYKAIDALTGGEVGKEVFKSSRARTPFPWPGARTVPRTLELQERNPQAEDLKGLKIRVVGSPLFLETFTALGANPTQMSWRMQYRRSRAALWTARKPLTIFTAAKLHSAANQKNLTLWAM